MIIRFALNPLLTLLALGLMAPSWALTMDDLRPDAPQCKMPQAAVPDLPPKLPSESEDWDTDEQIFADFTGNGWCDYALGVPYPINSKMNSFGFNDIMKLGDANGWRDVLHGKQWFKLPSLERARDGIPLFNIDLTDIHLVYPKKQGAPYVIGLAAAVSTAMDPWIVENNPPHCKKYTTVYRWDPTIGAFKITDPAATQVVLQYYYAKMAEPCIDAGQCRAYPSCRYLGAVR